MARAQGDPRRAVRLFGAAEALHEALGKRLQAEVRGERDAELALAQAEALTGLVQATVATVLGPLVAELAASRQTNERQAERLAAQAETIGRVTATVDALTAAQTKHASILAAQAEPASSEAPVPWWRSWWPVVLSIALWEWKR